MPDRHPFLIVTGAHEAVTKPHPHHYKTPTASSSPSPIYSSVPIYKFSSRSTSPPHSQMAPPPHLLFVTVAAQGLITPARHLARRLARTAASRVTLATPISSHRRLFPSSDPVLPVPDPVDPLISYAAYSDGHDDGFDPQSGDGGHFMAQLKLVGPPTLSRLAAAIAAAGPPVTCVVYTVLTPWAADVARDVLSVPSVLFWPEPAAVFSIYYHYFRRSTAADLISANRNNPSFTLELPGLPSLRIKDLPTYVADADDPFVTSFEEIFRVLDKEKERANNSKPRVLVNTFYELESRAIDAVDEYEVVPIGPLGNEKNVHGPDLYQLDPSDYMEWLASKEAGSVVYVSFGSLLRPSKRQAEEMARGLEGCGRPYLWAVRRDGRAEDLVAGEKKGRVVEWCDQMRVLSHPSVGCFVTHCGWNSASEGMACGVPAVALPQGFEQATNARLVEGEWGNGVRAAVDEEGVVVEMELRRCLDLVMGEGGRGVEIRRRAEEWREKAREAVAEGGSSDRNLRAFVELI